VTVKVFKCCVSNATDGTDMLWNSSEKDGNIKESQEDKSIHCEDGDGDTDW
jgi:uncharacterized protein YuzB (UPF0349 family)